MIQVSCVDVVVGITFFAALRTSRVVFINHLHLHVAPNRANRARVIVASTLLLAGKREILKALTVD